jgi:hypothetical protein
MIVAYPKARSTIRTGAADHRRTFGVQPAKQGKSSRGGGHRIVRLD